MSWKKIIVSYLFILISTILLFFPIDILTKENYIINNISNYLLVNILLVSIIIFISSLAVLYFNNEFWRDKLILRIFFELLFTILLIHSMQFVIQNIFYNKFTLNDYILGSITDKSFFISLLESGFIILIIETIYSYNKRKENEIEREKFKYNQLKNQLNPHFLFNSLNILSAMIYTKSANESVEYIEKLSESYRYVLTNEDKNLILLRKEIEFIHMYGDVLKARFSDGFILKITLEEEDLNREILFMSLQLLVENAFKHNIASKEKPLIINIYSENGYIVVSNNKVIRLDNVISTGIGLKNLKERYKMITKREIEIIEDKEMFIVKIPMI